MIVDCEESLMTVRVDDGRRWYWIAYLMMKTITEVKEVNVHWMYNSLVKTGSCNRR